MKKLYIASAFLALLAGAASCSDNYDIYPEEYNEVLILKNGGEQNLTVYSTDPQTAFPVSVLKGGHKGAATSGSLRAMTDEEFNSYLEQSGRPFTIVPADCYTFSADGQAATAQINFSADEQYQIANVYVNTAAYKAFLERGSFDASVYTPVIPVVLESSEAGVNSNGSQLFIMPEYTEPKLAFTDDLISDNYRPLNLDNGVLSSTVTLPIENKWDINFSLALDEDAYNNYMAMNPNSGYTLVDQSAVTFETYSMPQGTSSINISLRIDTSKMKLTDMVPVKITNVSVDGLEADPNKGWFMADATIPLTADMLSTNAQEASEGPIANAIDGNFGTFFHSDWHGNVSDPHYFQVTLPKAYSKVMIIYYNRQGSYQSNCLYGMRLYTGTNDSNVTFHQAYAWNTAQPLIWNTDATPTVLKVPYDDANNRQLEFSTPQSVFRMVNDNPTVGFGQVFFCIGEFMIRAL